LAKPLAYQLYKKTIYYPAILLEEPIKGFLFIEEAAIDLGADFYILIGSVFGI